MVVEFEDASTSFCGLKSLFGSCLFTHDGASTSNKRVGWIQQQFVTPARSRHAWPWPRHAQSDWVRVFKTEIEIGTPARVEAKTWKFARRRGCSRALGTRGLYVLWNYYAANSHAATPARRKYRTRCDCHCARHISHHPSSTWVFFSSGLSGENAPVHRQRLAFAASVRSKKKKKKKKKVRMRTDIRHLQRWHEKFQRASKNSCRLGVRS